MWSGFFCCLARSSDDLSADGCVRSGWYRICSNKTPRVTGEKRKNLARAHRHLIWLEIVGSWAVFVVPFADVCRGTGFGQSKPWFCQYICPSGTLMAGIPLVASSEALQAAAGALFNWKVGLLIVTVLLAVWIYRPFCKYVCPLGAVYSFFNSIACYRYRVEDTCIRCGRCQEACQMDIRVWEKPNSPECIRCGACIQACPVHALKRDPLFSSKAPVCSNVKKKEEG